MPSNPITSQQIEEEKVEAVIDFLFLGCKITVDDDCSHEIKKTKTKPNHMILGRKAMTNIDSVLKSRDNHCAEQSPYSQSYGFSIGHVPM